MAPPSDIKVCTSGLKIPGCGRSLRLSEFYKGPHGDLLPYCKDCQRKASRRQVAERGEGPPKTCSVCGKEKPFTDFAYKRGGGGVLRDECRSCVSAERVRRYRESR